MSVHTADAPATAFELHRNAMGRLVFTDGQGRSEEGVIPVRAFPLAVADACISLVGPAGHELAWVARLADLSPPVRALIEEELASREFIPEVTQLTGVSTFSTPSVWSVQTDRGPATFVLKAEEDIRRLPERGRLLISSGHGLVFHVRDMAALDRQSRKLLERFL